MTDSWWDANFGWISHLFQYISIAIIVLAVLSLILICPLFAGLALAEGLAAFFSGTMVALTVLQTAFDGTAMVTGKESWVAFAADIAALATFGFGKLAEAAVRSAAEGAADTGKVVAFLRAGRDALRTSSLPGFLFSLANRSDLAASVMRGVGLSGKLDEAFGAASAARTALETAIKGADPGGWTTLFTMDGDLAGDYSKLDLINEAVPGVLRIQVARTMAQAIAGVDGIVQWSTFGGSGYITLHALTAGS